MSATSLIVVLLASAATGVATLALLPQLTAIPRERWSRAALRPMLLATVVPAISAGALAVVFRAPPPWALGICSLGGALAITRVALRYAPIRAVKRLTPLLTVDATRADAIAALGPTLDRVRPVSGSAPAVLSAWAQAALIAAAYLLEADEAGAARPILERLRGLTFRGPSEANHLLLWAHVELCTGDLAAAHSALAAIPRPIAMPLLAAHDEALAALALACERRSTEALERLDAWKRPGDSYAKVRLQTRLVAHLVEGDEAASGRTEAELRRRFGPRAVATARAMAEASVPAERSAPATPTAVAAEP